MCATMKSGNAWNNCFHQKSTQIHNNHLTDAYKTLTADYLNEYSDRNIARTNKNEPAR